jgi:hypothetical protein
MTFATLLPLLLTYGPSIIPLISKITAAIDAGRANETISAAEWADLSRLASQSAEDIYRRLGVTPPP